MRDPGFGSLLGTFLEILKTQAKNIGEDRNSRKVPSLRRQIDNIRSDLSAVLENNPPRRNPCPAGPI